MSMMDLYVWKGPVASSEDEANDLLVGDPDLFEPSDDVVRFYDELLARYPALESFCEDEIDTAETYWSVTPERSDRLIGMNLRWRVSDQMLNAIVELARKHELVLYDPQVPPRARRVADRADPPDPLVLRQALIGLLIGAVLVVGGWVVPIPVLDWIAIVIGAFLVLMALYSVVAWMRE